MLNTFDLFENFLDIFNNEHYLIICAKYHSSNTNDAHTACLADIVGLPCKSCMANHIVFEKESDFCMAFVLATGQPTWESAHEVFLKYNI